MKKRNLLFAHFKMLKALMVGLFFLFFYGGAFAQSFHLGFPVDDYFKQDIEDFKGVTINDKDELLLVFNNSIYQFKSYFNKLLDGTENISTISFQEKTLYYGSSAAFGEVRLDSIDRYRMYEIFNKVEGEVHRVVHSNYGDFILSKNTVFHFSENAVKKYTFPGIVDYMGSNNGSVIIHDDTNGLSIFVGGRFKLINNSRFLATEKVVDIESIGNGEYIVATRSKGLFRFNGESFVPFAWDYLKNKKIRDILYIDSHRDEMIVITENKELLNFNMSGLIIDEKLYPYPLLALEKSKKNDCFIITTKGIHIFYYDLPFQKIDLSVDDLHGPITIFNDKLYWGTNNGLFYSRILATGNLLDARIRVKDTEGKVGKLDVVNNTLLMSHEDGLYDILPRIGARFIPDERFYNFRELERDYMIGFGHKSNYLLKKINNQWRVQGELNQLPRNPKAIVYDKYKNIWLVDRDYNLIQYKFNPIEISFEEVNVTRHKNRIDLFGLNGYAILIQNKKPLVFEDKAFKSNKELNDLFGEKVELEQIINDEEGNVWYIANNKVGLINQNRATGQSKNIIIDYPFSDPRSIYPYNLNNIFINNGDHYIHMDYQLYRDSLDVTGAFSHLTCQEEGVLIQDAIDESIIVDPKALCHLYVDVAYGPDQMLSYKIMKDQEVIRTGKSQEMEIPMKGLEQETYTLLAEIQTFQGNYALQALSIKVKKAFTNTYSFYFLLGLIHVVVIACAFFLGLRMRG